MITLKSTDGIRLDVLNKDGKPIPGVTRISIEPMSPGRIITAHLEIVDVRLELALEELGNGSELAFEVEALLKKVKEHNGKQQTNA